MNILVLSGSPRRGGNTDLLVEEFVKGASEKHNVEVLPVRDLRIGPCLGCNHCFVSREHACRQTDDMTLVYEKMGGADMLVVASPVYFYGISSQLKALVDRLHNPVRNSFNIRKMAILLVGASTLPAVFDSILLQYTLCLDFFKLEDAGRVLVGGVREKGDVAGTSAPEDAYRLGASL